MAGPFLAGVDVGTTSVKAALFDAKGAMLAQRSSLIATQRPGAGLVEQAPEDWMSATLAGLEASSTEFRWTLSGDRTLQPGQHPCFRRRERQGAGAGDHLAGRSLR